MLKAFPITFGCMSILNKTPIKEILTKCDYHYVIGLKNKKLIINWIYVPTTALICKLF
jgi:hypothetical protein